LEEINDEVNLKKIPVILPLFSGLETFLERLPVSYKIMVQILDSVHFSSLVGTSSVDFEPWLTVAFLSGSQTHLKYLLQSKEKIFFVLKLNVSE
jgi:hypothetical protein